ncbi:hypothetical protein CgunFtcFv8_000217 [Champsocephalus gunnari]|uniref:Uncharacterized protein n=1 Tax=Champsocephalus gunnari TaxID=52237 RepID=A0AAN8HP41_CHAGU|nr:hypothetical protein CgunFtcFv8_000217 [Champsocephalus gunnari]
MTQPGWDKETIAQSASLKQKLEDFDFTFLLGVFQSIFGLTEPLFQVLQSKTVHIKKGQDQIMSTLSALKATRTDETFSRIYDETVKAVGDPVPDVNNVAVAGTTWSKGLTSSKKETRKRLCLSGVFTSRLLTAMAVFALPFGRDAL